MKKRFKYLILFSLVFILCGCSSIKNDKDILIDNKTEKITEMSKENSNDYIIHTEKEEYNINDERILILFHRKDGENFKFFTYYNIYKKVNNKWILLSFKDNVNFHNQEVSVNKTAESINNVAEGFQYIYFKEINLEITEGTYKIEKEFEGKIASCEFTIK